MKPKRFFDLIIRLTRRTLPAIATTTLLPLVLAACGGDTQKQESAAFQKLITETTAAPTSEDALAKLCELTQNSGEEEEKIAKQNGNRPADAGPPNQRKGKQADADQDSDDEPEDSAKIDCKAERPDNSDSIEDEDEDEAKGQNKKN